MKTQFICEKCGEAYDTAEDAKKCEANHGDRLGFDTDDDD